MAVAGEDKFKEALTTIYGLNPGDPRYEAALIAWREAQSSR
jgi:hypothetical protein